MFGFLSSWPWIFVLLWFCSPFHFPIWVWVSLFFLPFCLHRMTSLTRSKEESGQRSMGQEEPMDDFEVFLSFRGPDTRQGFTAILYDTMVRAGIRVFKDDDELSIGEPIKKILHAIANSQMCVPIFSKTFASSAWCLDEVAKIVELNKDVVPIFYDVDPDDVKLKSARYNEYLNKQRKKYGKKRVKMWEDALKAVARHKGKEVGQTSYIEFCKKFVDEVLRKLKPRKKYDIDYLVGINNQVESVMQLLDIESHDLRYIGIHGMGGIGKTTLAKIIFNELSTKFDCSCFLEDIRESSSGPNGLNKLQKKLQGSLDPKSIGTPYCSRDIKEMFRKKKVLIVLDDVDQWEQIEKLAGKSSWFGVGSRIIVTTRNVHVLNEYGVLEENEVLPFEMMTLDDGQALQLFNRYAFRKDAPSVVHEALSREIVSTAGGLPLALKIIGSLLYKKDEAVWREIISRSRKIPVKKVKERLKISYDELEDDQKQVFLDIACLSVVREKEKAIYMWEASELYPHWGLAVLSAMSLVKVDQDNKIWMHDQLKDLGRDIVRTDSIQDPRKQSRLWEHEEAFKVLMSKEGKEKVEALSLDKPLDITLSREHFETFQQLRLLKLAGANVEGNFEDLLPKLAWLSWHSCSLKSFATSLHLKSLVILDLSHSFISEIWDLGSIQNLNTLKVLDLSNCHNLTRTPHFSGNKCLERLVLHGCNELGQIDGSINKLKGLKYLYLTDCYSLSGLPEEIGSLENLEELVVSGNHDVFYLPESIGNLQSLLVLTLEKLKIINVPGCIGGLTKLKQLSLAQCYGIKELPESLGDLVSLVKLDISNMQIRELPNSIGRLVNLESLNLLGCTKIKELPESLGNLRSLVELVLMWTNVSSLPESIGRLQELKVLKLFKCKIKKLPASIGMLKKLEEFSANSSRLLDEIPKEIGRLSSLRELSLSHSRISTLPSTIRDLPLLQELHLEHNNQLQELPRLPSSLTKLNVSSTSLQRIHDLSKLNNLTELKLLDINYHQWPRQLQKSNFEGLEMLTKLKRLELGLPNAITLPFPLGSLTQLESLRLYFPTTSSDSVLSSDGPQMKLLDLSDLKNLSEIGFYNCLINSGLEELGLQGLDMVEDVFIENCCTKLIELCLLSNLTNLSILNCRLIKTLPDLSHLINLEYLQVSGCEELVEIPGLGKLVSLDMLVVAMCDSLERLENLSKLQLLSTITVHDCPRLRSIEGVDKLFLCDLYIYNCESMENVDELRKRSKEGAIDFVSFENFGG